ncbi:hypothetical protein TA3x_001846 [Tundrisphaera sp. TA3]|uniref:hypothetical protein n=1 Tax=Tundrisphaera sp. TA3 TaxID=3435775 RepID=UPI003EB7D719
MRLRHLLPIALAALIGPNPARADEPAAFFPIMAWNAPPDDPAALRKMRECGINVAGFVRIEGLDRCRDAGLKAIVSDPRLDADWTQVDPAKVRGRIAEVVKQARDHPAVYGYYFRDEPSAALFPGLRVAVDAVRELHPGAWPYINLLPTYATPEQLGTPTYDAYLERFVAECRPTTLSYDHYALMEGGTLRAGYFANLAAMRGAAVKHGLPFWNIVLSVAHFNYREPTAADFRFQAYTSLAYGARGLAYFTYFGSTTGNYRMAPIDAFGHETATWGWMRDVNLQVAQLAPTLLKLKSDRVYHFGEIPDGCAGPDDQSLVKAIAGPILVGDFTHEDGSRYILVVNRSTTASIPGLPQLRDPSLKLEKVSAYTGKVAPLAGEDVWLAPGQGALLKLAR